jgi:hypothetical protein
MEPYGSLVFCHHEFGPVHKENCKNIEIRL